MDQHGRGGRDFRSGARVWRKVAYMRAIVEGDS